MLCLPRCDNADQEKTPRMSKLRMKAVVIAVLAFLAVLIFLGMLWPKC
jgi:hypothetical protein